MKRSNRKKIVGGVNSHGNLIVSANNNLIIYQIDYFEPSVLLNYIFAMLMGSFVKFPSLIIILWSLLIVCTLLTLIRGFTYKKAHIKIAQHLRTL